MPAPPQSASRNEAIDRIRLALIEKKMTQAELADAADCHEKTIQNLLAGRTVRDQTLFDVCMVLGLDFDSLKQDWTAKAAPSKPFTNAEHLSDHRPDTTTDPFTGRQPSAATNRDIAPVYMGAYTRAAVDHLIGTYLTIRPAFTRPDTIIAYRTDITWDADWPSLLFEERNRPDGPYAHRGRLHVPPSSSFIHLVSLTKGAMRMIIVSQLDQMHLMRGLVTTLAKRGAVIAPVSAPIVYQRLDDPACGTFGTITIEDAAFNGYRSLLQESMVEGYCSMIAP